MKNTLLLNTTLLFLPFSCNNKKTHNNESSAIEPECPSCMSFVELDTTKTKCDLTLDTTGIYFRNHYTIKECEEFYKKTGPFPEESIGKSIRILYNDSLASYSDGSDIIWMVKYVIKDDSLILTNERHFFKPIVFTFNKNCKGKLIGENGERFYMTK